MAKAQAGKTYAIIQNNRCHSTFTSATLAEWNENQIQVVDVTGNIPNVGDDWNGSSFVPHVATQEETAAAAKNSSATTNKNDVINDANVLAFVERTPAQVVADINSLTDVASVKAYLRNPILALHYVVQGSPLDKS